MRLHSVHAVRALNTVRARGLKVTPRCDFVRAYVGKHPEVHDLLA